MQNKDKNCSKMWKHSMYRSNNVISVHCETFTWLTTQSIPIILNPRDLVTFQPLCPTQYTTALPYRWQRGHCCPTIIIRELSRHSHCAPLLSRRLVSALLCSATPALPPTHLPSHKKNPWPGSTPSPHSRHYWQRAMTPYIPQSLAEMILSQKWPS